MYFIILRFIVSGLFWHKMSLDCVALFRKILPSAKEGRSWHWQLEHLLINLDWMDSMHLNFQSLKKISRRWCKGTIFHIIGEIFNYKYTFDKLN